MKRQIETKEQLFDEINKYITNKDDIDFINKAYEYAYEKHKDQKRKSGEPYFVHVLNVAYELARLKADPSTICSGLLHDVLKIVMYLKKNLSLYLVKIYITSLKLYLRYLI